MTDKLLDEARRAALCVYLLTDEHVARDVSSLLSSLVARIEALDAELTEVKARLEARTGET